MKIELNQTTFRRLVQLHIAWTIIVFVTFSRQFILPSWVTFGAAFDQLAATHFRSVGPSDALIWPAMGLALLLIGWMIASMVGLLWFQRWARFGTWASTIGSFVLLIAIFGTTPGFSTPLDDALSLVDSALFGAILLLAYAKGYGEKWFAPATARIEE